MSRASQDIEDNNQRINLPLDIIHMGLYIGAIRPEDITINGEDAHITFVSNPRPQFLNGRRVYGRDDIFYEFMRRVHIFMNRDPHKERNVLGNITSFTINAENKYRAA
ncbi:Hypothetical protein SRAE_X000054300 [Strongyloides ratti]|uniref:Uncharacterized protein n=1 Tax=Strongyloides ratti TaxID=34506 RepID=A0A090LNC2_STRRB|nr:Hypothetical protein SRAE_X000054300 [Strongyloides ratti]CEF71216.1 Hypothetical protein SRAE_X000054300 [Strongyloides ratti]